MSKFKLFLLTGIVSILSIGCFTNAKNYVVSSDGGIKSAYSPSSITFGEPFNKVVISSLDCPTGFCFIRTSCGDIQTDGNNNIYNYASSCTAKTVSFEGVGGAHSFGKIVFSDNSFDIYDGGLTPAIDGLRGTVNQIIPYVIYIGIGVLLAILGFYGIRRLVNRIAGKINSIFRSKRN